MEILKGIQVFIVDNDSGYGEIYKFLLNPYEANVTYFQSVSSALKSIDYLMPNILICEIRFLGESVYQLIEKLNAMSGGNKNRIPVIITSTYFNSRLKIPDIEFDSYFLKPFDPEKLVSTIANLIEVIRNNSLPYNLL